jgi:hypothetical protein
MLRLLFCLVLYSLSAVHMHAPNCWYGCALCSRVWCVVLSVLHSSCWLLLCDMWCACGHCAAGCTAGCNDCCCFGMPHALCLGLVMMLQLQVLPSVNVFACRVPAATVFAELFTICTCARLPHAYSVAGHCTFCLRSTTYNAVGCAACRPASVCLLHTSAC